MADSSNDVMERGNNDWQASKNIDTAARAEKEPSVPVSYEALRSSPRNRFEYNQRVAPVMGKQMPSISEYMDVECNDISRGGISFFLKRDPTCKHFAVALGQKPNVSVMLAEVCRREAVVRDGHQMYLVGCKFVGKAPLSPAEIEYFGHC
jgi:hypothetical protein